MGGEDVVITGLGLVTPLGVTAETCISAWAAGAVAARTTLPELAGTVLEGAEVAVLPPFDAGACLPHRRLLKYMSQAAVLGCIAAHEAVTQSRLSSRVPPERIGLFAATGLTAAALADTLPMVASALDPHGRFSSRLFGARALAATNPLLSFHLLANMPACLVSILEGVRGPSYIFTPWEGQGAAALMEAWRAVAAGEVDAAVAGASGNAASPSGLVLLCQRGLLQEGEVPASGAAYLVFERASQARRDGLTARARIADLSLSRVGGPAGDPLAPRMGRTFAVAPALLLALAAGRAEAARAVSGVDGQVFRFSLEADP